MDKNGRTTFRVTPVCQAVLKELKNATGLDYTDLLNVGIILASQLDGAKLAEYRAVACGTKADASTEAKAVFDSWLERAVDARCREVVHEELAKRKLIPQADAGEVEDTSVSVSNDTEHLSRSLNNQLDVEDRKRKQSRKKKRS